MPQTYYILDTDSGHVWFHGPGLHANSWAWCADGEYHHQTFGYQSRKAAERRMEAIQKGRHGDRALSSVVVTRAELFDWKELEDWAFPDYANQLSERQLIKKLDRDWLNRFHEEELAKENQHFSDAASHHWQGAQVAAQSSAPILF